MSASDPPGQETMLYAPIRGFIAGALRRAGEPVVRTPTQLASAPVLLGFAALLGAMIVLVFPSRREYADLAGRGAADTFSVAYLRVALQASPHDLHLRLVYVRMLTELGEYDLALDALALALADSPRDLQVLTARFNLHLARMRAQAEGSPARAEGAREVVMDLEALLDLPLDVAWLERGAVIARELGAPGLSGRYRLRQAEIVPPGEVPAALVAAGEAFREVGDGVSAAAAYQRAAAAETDRERALPIAILATRAMEGADRVKEAAELAESFLPRFGGQLPMIDRVIELETRAGKPGQARHFGRLRLALVDNDVERYAQMRRELGAGDPDAAFQLIAALRAKHPQDPLLRLVEARVAEWSSHPDVALRDWLSLLDQRNLPRGIPERWEPTP